MTKRFAFIGLNAFLLLLFILQMQKAEDPLFLCIIYNAVYLYNFKIINRHNTSRIEKTVCLTCVLTFNFFCLHQAYIKELNLSFISISLFQIYMGYSLYRSFRKK